MADSDETSSGTHIFGTGQRRLSLKQSLSALKAFDSRLLNAGQKQLFTLKPFIFWGKADEN